MTKPITDEQLAKWRKDFNRRQMTSCIEEYCPEEFGDLLDEVAVLRERLRLAEAVVEAAIYVAEKNRSWSGVDRLRDAVASYRAATEVKP